VLDGVTSDDSDSPAIGLVPAGASWDDVRDHIKIVHGPLLVWMDDTGGYVGAYWDGTQMVVAEDLGSDQEQAIEEFRDFLRENGEE
jgi:hypothetical protein